MGEDAVTRAELQSVRGEALARIAEVRAEMHGEMRALSAEVRSAVEASTRDVHDIKNLVTPLIPRLEQIETRDEREAWVTDYTTRLLSKLGRRVIGTLTAVSLTVGIATALIAIFA